ncbi:hypothetical protein DSCO28_60410 [Desulfosarcina ovata subsp. sediminis]|uniref:Fibronectin type-III domain-containing protein n=1 Tax=Desulfosarcina ovata subsp. sediminis TaxID=885957 RepID=A0A5K7ZYW5_9BACT|nr:choice-of-anchor U domain-containing protein [Desulfosarcina ovata]BBO85475.1 hypothetical protein DSCO28_60410 [Desulfosarcina ovata subsp. sediminis]
MQKKPLHLTGIALGHIAFILAVFFSPLSAIAANVTLAWDANDPEPEGYRVFAREEGQSYDYQSPLWESDETTCTLTGLVEGTTYYFVVRAYDGTLESADSEEVSYTPAATVANQAPSASAGDSQTVYEGDAVTLDGTASSDSDGSIASYLWEQTGGTSITISGTAQAQATFTAPVVDTDGESLTFSLTVTDDDGSTSVATTTVNILKSDSTDRDGDNVPDVLDALPEDPTEWADNDSDGIGDNADSDDDNDGMPDQWESEYGLDPYTDDAGLDADGDGVSNLEEYEAQTDPVASMANTVPDTPTIESVYADEFVGLTPVLISGAYFDPDSDDHYQSQWQISTENDFSELVLDETSTTQLTAYQVGDMVLDYDTVYYWRVRFIDTRSGESEWSEVSSFITAESSDDTDTDGVPDDQEVSESVDLNENGIDDALEDDLKPINTVEGQTVVGVKAVSGNITLFSVKSISSETVPDQSVDMIFGLIGFKLYLDEVGAAATVTIYFSTTVDESSQLYKYDSDTGWEVYEDSVFAEDRKSVTLTLVDGGTGDEDGVANGIIVDPSGISSVDSDTASVSSSSESSSSSGGGGGGGGCFIATISQENGPWIDMAWQWLKRQFRAWH